MISEGKKKYLFIIFVLNAFVSGLLPVLAVLIPRYIIDSIAIQNLQKVVIYISIFCIASIVLSIISHLFKGIAFGDFLALRLNQFSLMFQKFRFAAYEVLENPSFQAKRSVASKTLSYGDEGFQGTYNMIYLLLPQFVTIIGYTVILGLFKPVIIVIAIAFSLLQFVVASKAKQLAFKEKEHVAEAEREAQYFYEVGHDFSYGKDIRIHEMKDELLNLYHKKSWIYSMMMKKIKIHEYHMSIFDAIFVLIQNGIAYYFVITAYFQGQITLGQLSMTIWSILAITLLLQQVTERIAKLVEATKYTNDLMKFMNDEVYFPSNKGMINQSPSFEIEFRNVSFKYPLSDTYVLKNLSIHINSGERLALVGVNGCGKTTLVKLLCGFYKPTEGEILINGINLDEYNNIDYRTQIAAVFQESNIYAASILENIVGDHTEIEDIESAITALDKVGLKDKIQLLPHHEHTQLLKIIDPEGTELSGGETQKLSMARALNKQNTKLMILDEPTASLDAIAEKELYLNFDGLIGDKTAILISHRLASTRFCDKIAFMQNGEILEVGTHEELMAFDLGKYKEMFITQGKYYRKEDSQNEEEHHS